MTHCTWRCRNEMTIYHISHKQYLHTKHRSWKKKKKKDPPLITFHTVCFVFFWEWNWLDYKKQEKMKEFQHWIYILTNSRPMWNKIVWAQSSIDLLNKYCKWIHIVPIKLCSYQAVKRRSKRVLVVSDVYSLIRLRGVVGKRKKLVPSLSHQTPFKNISI